MRETAYIYGVLDERGELRYVGRTAKPAERESRHLSGNDPHTKRVSPKRVVYLDSCPSRDAPQVEARWIRFAGSRARLVNGGYADVIFEAVNALRSSTLADHEIANKIPISAVTVPRWRAGTTKPSRFKAQRILAVLKPTTGRSVTR